MASPQSQSSLRSRTGERPQEVISRLHSYESQVLDRLAKIVIHFKKYRHLYTAVFVLFAVLSGIGAVVADRSIQARQYRLYRKEPQKASQADLFYALIKEIGVLRTGVQRTAMLFALVMTINNLMLIIAIAICTQPPLRERIGRISMYGGLVVWSRTRLYYKYLMLKLGPKSQSYATQGEQVQQQGNSFTLVQDSALASVEGSVGSTSAAGSYSNSESDTKVYTGSERNIKVTSSKKSMTSLIRQRLQSTSTRHARNSSGSTGKQSAPSKPETGEAQLSIVHQSRVQTTSTSRTIALGEQPVSVTQVTC